MLAKLALIYVAGYVISCILFLIDRRIEIKRVHIPSVTVPVIMFVSLGSWLTVAILATGLLHLRRNKMSF